MIEYRTISAFFEIALDSAVTEELRQGWKLYGNPYVMTGVAGSYICQAMTRSYFVEMEKVGDEKVGLRG